MSELGWEHALEAARKLWGPETSRARGGKELRFGSHGSKSLRCDGDDGPVWYDHEAGVGGGVHDLCLQAGTIKQSPWDDPGWRTTAMEYAAKQRGGPDDYSKYYDEALESEPGELLERLATEDAKRLIKTSQQFVADFTPPDFLCDRLLIQSFLYALTGQTGSGKTAITLRLAACIALGQPFAGLDVTKRRVLYLAAENPIDVQMRWIALAQEMKFDANMIDVFFVEGIFKISDLKMLQAEAEKVGGNFGLVVIDTGPAFYEGDDQNNRVEMFKHARTFRDLISAIPGKPTVLANMHPVKNAASDNLIPAGGGSFLNEIDGNLTADKDDTTIEVHWQGKIRGIEFAPLNFEVKTVTHPRLVDKKGKLIATVVACDLTEREREGKEAAAKEQWKFVLSLIADNLDISLSEIAAQAGLPHKLKAQRVINRMIKAKLIKRDAFGTFEFTDTGREVLDEFRANRV